VLFSAARQIKAREKSRNGGGYGDFSARLFFRRPPQLTPPAPLVSVPFPSLQGLSPLSNFDSFL